MKTITRKQLKTFGCSDYLARKLTNGVMYTKDKRERGYICQGVAKKIDDTLNNTSRIQYKTVQILEDLLRKIKSFSPEVWVEILESEEMAQVVDEIKNFNKHYPEICKRSDQAIQAISEALEEHSKAMQEYLKHLSPKTQKEFLQSIEGAV
ncbi:hypothetical protein BZZ01_00690 [Nostocales cyanobacterium HT-58-2]|nr:hypothetical protein BZZ01_00690 [Nostocales cyanobacterium HT-58-2]